MANPKRAGDKWGGSVRRLLLGLLLIGCFDGRTFAATDLLPNAEIQADPETVQSILLTFDRAEKALRARNLPEIMAIYSEEYQNLGLRKEETERIWHDLFSRYRIIVSKHLFSKIVVHPD
ncbi:MAG TPA: hypothetical protein VFA47_12070, partial [Candidatus Manganitrophaceae bacterium]|nr:hypothetical protein [Candidatus Manganitrophaceae bacterium]